jgi:hypothetical protein
MRFSSANASVTDHSFATGKLIEVNFFPLCTIRKKEVDQGAKSATGRTNRQISLRCLGMLRRNIGLAQALVSDASRINASNRKPVKFRMRLGGTPEQGGNHPHPAADGSQSIGGHDQTNPHRSRPDQSADRRPAY